MWLHVYTEETISEKEMEENQINIESTGREINSVNQLGVKYNSKVMKDEK